MKTPEEIKKFLPHCAGGGPCIKCHYDRRDFPQCIARLHDDALAYIQQLEAENTRRHEKIMQLYSEHENLTGIIQTIAEESKAAFQRLEAQVPKWISVEDKLPKHWRMDDKDKTLINYLVYIPEYGVDVGNWIKPAKRWVVVGIPANVTHWMPLPEPPKEDDHAPQD